MSVSAPAGSLTRTLAEFALGVNVDATAPVARHEAVRIFVDTVGCAVAGLVTASGQIASATVQGERGPLEATVVGYGPVTLGAAAFANTVLDNALDFEPVGPEGHVSAIAVPVALAVAEALDTSGEELLAGLIAGLEVGGRVGGAIRRVEQGGDKVTPPVRGTAHAVFAAVAAAGRIMRLSLDQMHHAFGIAGYSATLPTLKKVMSSSHSPMTKYDHLGLMAHNGIRAAQLAQRGFTGDRDVLEGEYGFWRFAGGLGCDWSFLTRDLGGSYWTIPETWFKRYPVILYANPGLDLVRRMATENGLRPEQIDRVEIRTTRTNPVQLIRRIDDSMDAWTSYPYTTAAALFDVSPRRSWHEEATYRRADLLALAEHVDIQRPRPDEVQGTGNYWEGWCPVRATMWATGRELVGAQDHLVKLDDVELSGKFQENVAGLVDAADARRLEDVCWNVGSLGSARELGRLLATARVPGASTDGGNG
jgi:2-methylcitrate dehydratase PrpD